MKKKKFYTDEALLNFIRFFYNCRGNVPTRKDLNASKNLPGYSTYRNRFGSYSNAVKKAGLIPNKRVLTKEEIKSMGAISKKVLRKKKIANRRRTKDGFIIIYKPLHYNSDSNGYIFEHRYLMSKHLKRNLYINEQVYHVNGINDDNRIKNLTLDRRSKV